MRFQVKKWFLSAVLLLSSLGNASEGECARLNAKAILKSTQGYFVLSDGSCWKVMGFQKRWRSVSEWWNGVQLVPENYECIPNDWYLGAEIEVYSKYESLEVNEEDASNQHELQYCTHLLFNTRTQRVLFARALGPEDCIVELFNDAYADGYEKGYNTGWQAGYSSGHSKASTP